MRKEIEKIIENNSVDEIDQFGDSCECFNTKELLTDQICSLFIERLEGLGRTEMSGWEYIDTIIKELKGE